MLVCNFQIGKMLYHCIWLSIIFSGWTDTSLWCFSLLGMTLARGWECHLFIFFFICFWCRYFLYLQVMGSCGCNSCFSFSGLQGTRNCHSLDGVSFIYLKCKIIILYIPVYIDDCFVSWCWLNKKCAPGLHCDEEYLS